MPQTSSNVKQRSSIKFQEPTKYNVIIHNDDFTPMDFVVNILVTLFGRKPEEALAIMLSVHHSERGIAGTYTLDIAQSKARKATLRAREAGYPLRFTVEPDLPF